jgi:thiamine thiazole synthase
MKLEETTISRLIVQSYSEKLLGLLEVDVAMVGAGPANLTAGYYLGRAGLRAVLFESKLAPGGGMWGGGMLFNEAVLQEEAAAVAEEMGVSLTSRGGGYYTFDTVEGAACLTCRCIQAGSRILNGIKVEDVCFQEEDGPTRVSGLVINWSPVKAIDLHVDPIAVRAAYVIDGTGHPAEIATLLTRKLGVRLNTPTGQVVGERPLQADEGEVFTVAHTSEVYPGLWVVGMAANNAYGGPRMGPIFGGMLLSGKKAAEGIIAALGKKG